MAKRELSTTLRGLKFMQRAARTQAEEKNLKKEEEIIFQPDDTSTVSRKCVVIMEGDPHPGAIIGRMSFPSSNPSIDKLNGEASNVCRQDASGGSSMSSGNGSAPEGAECSRSGTDEYKGNGDLKRKQLNTASEKQYPNKSPKAGNGVQSPSSSKASSKKQSKRDRLDWSVLKPPKSKKSS